MRASSEAIGQLAAAMARAQTELVNPPKSLTAVLERGRNGGGAFSYKYAPLSAGLDIMRKTLGKHELAVMQTTHVDRDRGLVLLTTTIARWALEILPTRNKLDEAGRAEFDAAFLARADAIGADPELLIAFRPGGAPAEFDNGPTTPTT